MMERISKDKNIPSAILGGVLFILIFDLIWLWYSISNQSQIACRYGRCASAEERVVEIRSTPL